MLTIVGHRPRLDTTDTGLFLPPNVVTNGSTGLGRAGKVYRDGRLWLDW